MLWISASDLVNSALTSVLRLKSCYLKAQHSHPYWSHHLIPLHAELEFSFYARQIVCVFQERKNSEQLQPHGVLIKTFLVEEKIISSCSIYVSSRAATGASSGSGVHTQPPAASSKDPGRCGSYHREEPWSPECELLTTEFPAVLNRHLMYWLWQSSPALSSQLSFIKTKTEVLTANGLW